MKGKVLQAYGDVSSKTQCQDCSLDDDQVRADFLILPEGDLDWKAVCEDCSYDYDWEEAEVEIDLNENEDGTPIF